jgi:hypothetical protein
MILVRVVHVGLLEVTVVVSLVLVLLLISRISDRSIWIIYVSSAIWVALRRRGIIEARVSSLVIRVEWLVRILLWGSLIYIRIVRRLGWWGWVIWVSSNRCALTCKRIVPIVLCCVVHGFLRLLDIDKAWVVLVLESSVVGEITILNLLVELRGVSFHSRF